MFQRILIPVDLTDKNKNAVTTARHFAETEKAAVTLLHVIEMLDVPFEEEEEFYKDLETNARERMAALAEPLVQAGLDLTQQIVYGKRVAEICSFAADHEVDLIILSSHRIDPQEPGRTWMTISHQVAMLADCSVLVVK